MGVVKRGINSYVVLNAVAPGDMIVVFAMLGNKIMFHYKANDNGTSSVQSYSNNNPYPSYGSIDNPIQVGDIVVISGLLSEVDIPVLGEANVGFVEIAAQYNTTEIFFVTPGTSKVTLANMPVDGIVDVEINYNPHQPYTLADLDVNFTPTESDPDSMDRIVCRYNKTV